MEIKWLGWEWEHSRVGRGGAGMRGQLGGGLGTLFSEMRKREMRDGLPPRTSGRHGCKVWALVLDCLGSNPNSTM